MSLPSFSSFPPSFGSFPDLEQDKASSGGSQGKEAEARRDHFKKDKHRRRSRDRHNVRRKKDHAHHKDRKQRNEERDDERAKREEDRHARLGANCDGAAPGLFVVDKVGDQRNIMYGGLHAGDIPRYRRAGFGNVMGLGKSFKIISRGTGGKSLEIGINGRRPPARYTDSHSLVVLTTARIRHLFPASHDTKGKGKIDNSPVAEADFIRIQSRRGQSNDQPLSTYRSIHTSKEEENSDSDASSYAQGGVDAFSSESDADDNSPRTAHQHSLAALDASLQKDPTSLATWFALLDQTLSTAPPSSKSSLARARAEIKLSVLDRAIRAHRQNEASVELRVKWLNAGAEVWDEKTQEREWERAVKELSDRGAENRDGRHLRNSMWEEWLRWRISSAGSGSRKIVGVEGIISDARRAMENTEGEMALVKILWRVAVVLKEAGFLERAMAVFQAQSELTFHCVPQLKSKPLFTRLDALEEFWDAEHPRIGERDARGWDGWDRERRPKSHLMSPLQRSASMDADEVTDPYTCWATDEARLDAESSMPKHEDDAGEDPYATVLFSDVRPLLIDITTPEAKHALRIAWLEFLGLHVPGFAASLCENPSFAGRDDIWTQSHLTRTPCLRQLFPRQEGGGKEREWDSYAGTIIAREKTYGPTFGCVKEWGLGVLDPLEGMKVGEGRMWEEVDVNGVNKELARRVFEQLRGKVGTGSADEEWDILSIAFEAASNLKSALKVSRILLSTARDSLPLWGVHANLERMRGKSEEARRIYDAALSATPVSVYSKTGEAALWWAWAEMEWLAGDDDRARAVILRAAGFDPTIVGAMAILRAKRGLEGRMRLADKSGRWKESESWACLRALLGVLSGGTGGVEEGMGVLEDYVNEFGLEGVPRESAWTRMLLLGWKHTVLLRRHTRRVAVRDKVAKVVRELDQVEGRMNTVVLGVFLECEKGESVWGRVRALVGEGGLKIGIGADAGYKSVEKGVTRRLWEVWLASWERGRWESEMERVRNSLGVGAETESTHGSAILWRIYVEFEIYCGQLRRAKALLFRAVSECPLVKELYLIAFGPLREVFSPRELEGWAESMAERGIRMHCGLDEYVGTGVLEEGGNTSESGGEDDLEREARDYRRLAPF